MTMLASCIRRGPPRALLGLVLATGFALIPDGLALPNQLTWLLRVDLAP